MQSKYRTVAPPALRDKGFSDSCLLRRWPLSLPIIELFMKFSEIDKNKIAIGAKRLSHHLKKQIYLYIRWLIAFSKKIHPLPPIQGQVGRIRDTN